jgi:hypothetical protein
VAKLGDVILRDALASRPAAGVEGRLFYDTTNSLLYRDNGTDWESVEGEADTQISMICVVIQSAASGNAIALGQYVDVEVPWACTINQVAALADRTGSIVVDLWVESYADYPPTVADSITGAAPVTITGADKSQDSTLSGWSPNLSAGDILRAYVDSCTDIEQVTVALKVTRTA